MAFGLDVLDELFDNLEIDVGLEQRHANFAQRGSMFSAESLPSPRRFLKTRWSLSTDCRT